MFRTLGLVLLLSLAAALSAGEDVPPPDKLKALIAALASETFDQREQASAELSRLGDAARTALDTAAAGNDADLRARAKELLTKLNLSKIRIVFAYSGEVRIANHDYSGVKVLAKGEAGGLLGMPAARLSPDGTKIVFHVGYPSILYLMDSDGGNKKRLTPENAKRYEVRPCFSPDGKRILFTSYDSDVEGDEQYQLWEMDADGGNRRKLCSNANDGVYLPDGRIVLQSFNRAHDRFLSIMDGDGAKRKALTAPDLAAEAPNVSPDGKTIVFAARGDIWSMNVDGSAQRKLCEFGVWNPCFSVDGKKIIFSEYGESHRPPDELKVLWSMNLDGTERKKLGAGDKPSSGNIALPKR